MDLKLLQVREASGEVIDSPEVVINIMAEEAMADRECLWVLHLNGRNRIIEKELVSIGCATNAVVHPREVFKKAILLGAAGIITCHNHPGGMPNPSPEDREIWKRLDEAGKILGISVIDHLVITTSGGYYSHQSGRSFNNSNKEKGG